MATIDSGRLLGVCVKDQWGLIDTQGKVVVPLQYQYATDLGEGLAYVTPRGTSDKLVVDLSGHQVGHWRDVETYSDFSEGLLDFQRNDKDGYLDRQGKVVIEPQFDQTWPFANGCAKVESDQGCGLINTQGEWIIRPTWEFFWPFAKDQRCTAFKVSKGPRQEAWGLMNRLGEIVVEPRFKYAYPTGEGLTAVAVDVSGQELFGFVDELGHWVIQPQFSNCGGSFENGSVGVATGWRVIQSPGGSVIRSVGDQWGIIDPEGKWIVKPQFMTANSFRDNRSLVYVGGSRNLDNYLHGGKFGYLDRTGKLVVAAVFDDAMEFDGGVASVEVERRRWGVIGPKASLSGWIDPDGKFVWSPTR